MEVITIESRAFKQLMDKLEALSEYVYSMERPVENEDENWVGSQEICQFLKISERTLQRLRANGKITYSCIGGKYYYQIGQIKKLLQTHIIKSSDECLQQLIERHRKCSPLKNKDQRYM
ncbi:MAG: helix-turn-helix domain-containing protein [Alistipes sp.]|uniref:helix-turn-helix domain-containing protein n=1 Tax=Alistipes TaxID=239759 RepID=UPI00101C124E|nr:MULTISPECIES: helix-turn-helix domain-containing protein [Alistipes]MBR2218055.1 helix-turn-helix domain-containing protein [Alistipes sp.]